MASSAIPIVFSPIILQRKKYKSGTLRPSPLPELVGEDLWSEDFGSRNNYVIEDFTGLGYSWQDGSMRTDIPTIALNHSFNVNYTIVSQCNPHITLFFFDNIGEAGAPVIHRSGRGWRGGFLLSIFERWLKLDLIKNLRLLRDMKLLPILDWSHFFLQRFHGNVTIIPYTKLWDYVCIISNPTEARMTHYLDSMEHKTWYVSIVPYDITNDE